MKELWPLEEIRIKFNGETLPDSVKSTTSGTHNSRSIALTVCFGFQGIIAIILCDYETTPLHYYVIAIYGNNLVTLGSISILPPMGFLVCCRACFSLPGTA